MLCSFKMSQCSFFFHVDFGGISQMICHSPFLFYSLVPYDLLFHFLDDLHGFPQWVLTLHSHTSTSTFIFSLCLLIISLPSLPWLAQIINSLALLSTSSHPQLVLQVQWIVSHDGPCSHMVPLNFTNRFCSGKFTLHWHSNLLILQHLFLTPHTVCLHPFFIPRQSLHSVNLPSHTHRCTTALIFSPINIVQHIISATYW